MANAQLIVSQPGRRMRRIEVSSGLVSIGRRADNTLSLEGDTNVSKYHAVIEERGGAYWLTDLGSSNGTLVNNEPLRGERKLSDGDLINLGGTSTVEFRLAHDAADAANGMSPDAGGAGAAGGAAGLGGGAAGAAGGGGAGGAGGAAQGGGGAGLWSAAQGAQSGANSALSSASSSVSSASSAASSLGSFSPTARASSAASSALAPANSAMSSANSAMSSASSAASRATSAAAAPGEAVRSALAPRLIVGSVAGVTLLAVAVAILFATGAVGGGKKPAGKDDPASIDELLETPPAASSAADNATKSGDAPGAPGANAPGANAPPAPPASDAPSAPALPPSSVVASGDVSPQEIAGLSSMLAAQITGRSGSSYTFDPNFVARIRQHIDEYRTAAGYYERARKYQGAVDKEFSYNRGITPLLAYLLAMSRTRFEDRGAGVWQLPPAVSKFYAPDMTPADASDPDKSARVAATYTKALLDTFGKENFMYAVACYGMPVNDAGNVITALHAKDPGGEGRFDFWKMKNAGVVGGEQIDNVARFFAAGIVCENPQRFGLRQDRQLSSLSTLQ